MARARSDHRRLLAALVVAIMAAALTYGGLGSALNRSEQSSDHQVGPPAAPLAEAGAPAADRGGAAIDDAAMRGPVVIGDDHRTLALDGHTVLLPTEVGHQVEVVALVPTVESVKASVVAESATVVAVDESVVVIRLTVEEARRAVEALAVGSLILLGSG